jgi:sialate O-acetylesterase
MKNKLTHLLILLLLLIGNYSNAQIKLPRLIRDSMILQRDKPVNIWGWAGKKEKVKIILNKHTYQTVADDQGNWKILLAPMKAGGPYEITLKASNTITIHDVLFGDVWICTGQSNMVHQMEAHNIRYESEIASANFPEIRNFIIPNATDTSMVHDDIPSGSWKWANPKDVNQFSAVAYFFAKKIYEKYHIPIGIINASVGGTPIEAWTSKEGLENIDSGYINKQKRMSVINNPPFTFNDRGLLEKWNEISYEPKGWHSINVPGYWEDQGVKDFDGVMWYRKEINLKSIPQNVASKIFLGRIVDADNVFVNGKKIGNTTYMYPQRRYPVPAGLLKEGKNTIVVRVENINGKGGFMPDKPYCLIMGNDTVDLKGEWHYKVGAVLNPATKVPGAGSVNAYKPTSLYNTMIAPIINYTCKGFVWYQGETNAGKPEIYEKLQTNLIRDWRNKWNDINTPFLYVQLPGYMDMNYLPSESNWARLRESQLNALSESNTAMAIAIDLGEWNDIHPDRKKEVGDRLALAAQHLAYDEKNIEYSGPLYQSSVIKEDKIIINFTHVGNGLISMDNEELNYFSIAGEDKKFVWAKAKIEGDKVIVWNSEITHPKYVRYAWADNPDGANLGNKEGLPASPFRTDK